MTDFTDIQRNAVRRFLQTALVVDDNVVTEEPLRDLEASAAGHAGSQVNVKRLADAFADQGISCAILQPAQEDSNATTRIVNAAALADIIVLDWRMNDEDGRHAIDAIKEIISDPGRDRRLIAIYTTQRDLEGIAGAIYEQVPGAQDPADGADELNLTVLVGGTKILILNKGGVRLEPEELEQNKVTQEELPARLVEEFQRHTEGLVSAVVLNALAAARENTHRILQRLSEALDLGYVGHILRIEHLDDATDHLIDAVADEFRGVIQTDERTRNVAGSEGFFAWLDAKESQFQVDRETIDAMLEADITDRETLEKLLKRFSQPKVHERAITGLLAGADDLQGAGLSDARFSMLLSLRPPEDAPSLHLGTIVFDTHYGRYWLCIQPVCDSVRLKAPTRFAFLRLEALPSLATESAFHMVVDGELDDAPPVLLFAGSEPSDIYCTKVSPGADETARFVEKGGSMSLALGGDRDFVWRGELKPAHAQRVVDGIGGQLSRVGLDESEWLRLRGKESKKRDPADTWEPEPLEATTELA